VWKRPHFLSSLIIIWNLFLLCEIFLCFVLWRYFFFVLFSLLFVKINLYENEIKTHTHTHT